MSEKRTYLVTVETKVTKYVDKGKPGQFVPWLRISETEYAQVHSDEVKSINIVNARRIAVARLNKMNMLEDTKGITPWGNDKTSDVEARIYLRSEYDWTDECNHLSSTNIRVCLKEVK